MEVVVAKGGELPVGTFQPVQSQGKRLLLCHTEHGFSAIDDACTHDDGSLAEGWLEGGTIECPRHGARFDVRTGEVRCLPAVTPIRSYPVRVDDNTVYITV